MPSLLRRIFVEGNQKALDQAFQDMVHLIQISDETRARMLDAFKKFTATGKKPTAKLEIKFDPNNSVVPELFFALAKKLQQAPNPHYQEALICLYMLHDSELFARWMLYEETEQFQSAFMHRLSEMAHHFVDGVKIKTGEPFTPKDNLRERKTWFFISTVRDHFACM